MFFTQTSLLVISIIACDAYVSNKKRGILYGGPPIYSNGHGGFVPSSGPSGVLHDHGYGNGYGPGYGLGYGYGNGNGILHGVGIGPGVGLVGGGYGVYAPSYGIAAGHGYGPVYQVYRTIVNRVVPVPIPVPQPISVTRKIPVPVPHPVPVDVKRPVPVPVPHPVPIFVNRGYPVNVPRPVPVPVPQPVHVSYPVPQPISIPQPIQPSAPVPLPQPLPIGPDSYPAPLPPQNIQSIASIGIGQVGGETGTILEGGQNSGFAISSDIVSGSDQSAGFVGLPGSELHLSEQSGEGYSYPVPAKKFL